MIENEPEGLTPEAQKELEEFGKRYQRILKKAKSFSVLVWGPAPSKQSAVSDKRKQIRAELIRRGHNAMFSEDISTSETGLSEKTKEFAQARAAHLIIALIEDSPGALAEVHDFCESSGIIEKIFVMAPQKYKDGYSAKGALADLGDGYGGVFWYDEDDLASCKVLQRAVRRVEARKHILMRRKRR